MQSVIKMGDSSPRMPDLFPLLRANSVAIVGISQPDRFGGLVYANLRDFGYEGSIYGVNPRYENLFGQPCYPSLDALPERPDLAVLAIPNRALLPAFEETAALGIPAALIFGSAHAEFGDPRATERAIADLARQHDIAVCGPNCMGFLAFANKLVLSGYPVTPGTPPGHITLISHSGSVFDSLWQNNRDIHFNYAISSGNETVTTLADYMQFALADPTTRVIALFIETIRDPAGFTSALEEAASRDIPIVAYKVGRSAHGARLAQTHSGALAGDDAIYNALFARHGVRRVQSLDEMMDTLELFATGWRVRPLAIAATLDSGGERGMLVDMAEEIGVPFAQINDATRTSLTAILDPGLDPINPLDAWGTGNETGRIYRQALLALDADPATGLNLLAVDLMRASDLPPTYPDIVLPILPQFRKPLAVLVNITAAASEGMMSEFRAAGIPVLMGTETGLRAIRHLLAYSAFQDTPRAAPAHTLHPDLARLRAQLAAPPDEHTAKALLARYGIRVPPEQVANTLEDAINAADQIGYPVALKTASGLQHKTDSGGVFLNLNDPAGVRQAYRALEDRFGPRVLVQKMLPPGVELILGLIHDPQFGLFLALGLGGVFAEILGDTRLLALPASPGEIRAALRSLQGAALLRGWRGQPAVDEDSIINAALALAALAADLGDLIAEVDINPLIAYPDGAFAVDALIVLKNARI